MVLRNEGEIVCLFLVLCDYPKSHEARDSKERVTISQMIALILSNRPLVSVIFFNDAIKSGMSCPCHWSGVPGMTESRRQCSRFRSWHQDDVLAPCQGYGQADGASMGASVG